jgi:hypothetical protein
MLTNIETTGRSDVLMFLLAASWQGEMAGSAESAPPLYAEVPEQHRIDRPVTDLNCRNVLKLQH